MAYKILLAAGATLALGLAACERPADTTNADMAAANDMAANDMANESAMAEAPMATADFIAAAAASDMYETEAGRLAAEKGSTQAVKDFGTMLQAEHKSSADQLKAAVAETPSTMPAPELNAEQQGMIEALKAASGEAFDRAFLDQQIQAHTKALAMLNAYAAGGDSEPLKQFATKASPVVQGHLDKAKSMSR